MGSYILELWHERSRLLHKEHRFHHILVDIAKKSYYRQSVSCYHDDISILHAALSVFLFKLHMKSNYSQFYT